MIRGSNMKDSGMSDSSFYNFQDKLQKKMESFSAKLDNDIKTKELQNRFSNSLKRVNNKSYWQRLRDWINGK